MVIGKLGALALGLAVSPTAEAPQTPFDPKSLIHQVRLDVDAAILPNIRTSTPIIPNEKPEPVITIIPTHTTPFIERNESPFKGFSHTIVLKETKQPLFSVKYESKNGNTTEFSVTIFSYPKEGGERTESSMVFNVNKVNDKKLGDIMNHIDIICSQLFPNASMQEFFKLFSKIPGIITGQESSN